MPDTDAVSPTGKPLVPPAAVPWLMVLAVPIAVWQALPLYDFTAKVWHPENIAGFLGLVVAGLLGAASPGLRSTIAKLMLVLGFLALGDTANAAQEAIFEASPGIQRLDAAPAASPFTPAFFVGAGRTGLLQGASLNVDLVNVYGHAVGVGVLTAASEDFGFKLPVASSLGALLSVGLVEQKGWLLSIVGGVQWVGGQPSPFGGIAFHFLSPPGGG